MAGGHCWLRVRVCVGWLVGSESTMTRGRNKNNSTTSCAPGKEFGRLMVTNQGSPRLLSMHRPRPENKMSMSLRSQDFLGARHRRRSSTVHRLPSTYMARGRRWRGYSCKEGKGTVKSQEQCQRTCIMPKECQDARVRSTAQRLSQVN